MQFYVLDNFPRGPAETCMSEAEGSKQGNAPKCSKCGAYIGSLSWLPPFQVELELIGEQFGDFVFGAGDDFLVSESFVELYRRENLTGLAGLESVQVIKIKSRRRKRPDPPAYHRAVVSRGRTAIDLAASGFEWLEPPTCMECHSAIIVRWQRIVIEDATWSGDDIFIPRGLPGAFIVSERFKHVCESNNVKNAIFLPAESYGRDFYPGMKDPSELESPSE
jgi:hypothetical protein